MKVKFNILSWTNFFALLRGQTVYFVKYKLTWQHIRTRDLCTKRPSSISLHLKQNLMRLNLIDYLANFKFKQNGPAFQTIFPTEKN